MADNKGHGTKKMLLISTLFFGYYKEIMHEAEKLGFSVDFICDAPSNSNISKALGRVNKKIIEGSTRSYFKNKVLPKIKTVKYDVVFLVTSMSFSFTPDMLKKIRELNPDAKFIMYQWDGEINLPFANKIHRFFDRVYTFDRFDSQNNSTYIFLPLFYTQKYSEVPKICESKIEYDCVYVGTAHPKKYREINEMSESLKPIFPKQMIYHYMPSKLKFIYHKILDSEYRNAKLSDFQNKKLTEDEITSFYSHSKCILDAPQKGQNGLTMRTIECLGSKRKLITTNKDIVNYDFYRETNILVYNGIVDFKSSFFTDDYEELPQEIYEKYSLRNWLKTMLYE